MKKANHTEDSPQRAVFCYTRGVRLARVQGFYNTTIWQNCRDAYVKSVGGLCERCYENGIIKHGDTVHHKIHLTPDNVSDPSISLNFDNLVLLCRDCHAAAHRKTKRYQVDDHGRVLINGKL